MNTILLHPPHESSPLSCVFIMFSYISILQKELIHLSRGLRRQDFFGHTQHPIGTFHQLVLIHFSDQNFISAYAWQIISKGFLINFFSKHALFLLFQMAQQIAPTPHGWNFLPNGNHFSHQNQHCCKLQGMLFAPKHFATTIQITLTMEH